MFGHSEAKKARVISSSRYANCMQNNKRGFPVVLTGWKAAVAFGWETGRLGLDGEELQSVFLGKVVVLIWLVPGGPCTGQSEVASVKGTSLSVRCLCEQLPF